MYKRILVPLDGSKLAEQVLPHARRLATAFGLDLDLLSTFGPSHIYSGPNPSSYPHQVEDNFRAQSMDYLHSIKSSMVSLGVPVSCTVRLGEPASWIVSEAERDPNTLIAMSTHGRSGMTRWVLGSVADKVVHATTVPILLLRSQDEGTPTKESGLTSVIVPLDGSSLAEQVLPHVVALSSALRISVTLVVVSSHH